MWYNSTRFSPLKGQIKQKESGRYYHITSVMNPGHHPPQINGNQDRALVPLPSECSLALHSIADLGTFVELALDVILALADGHTGSFFIWDEYAKELVLKAARGINQDRLQGTTIRLREGIGGWVGHHGCPVLVKDIRIDTQWADFKKDNRCESYSFISVPLIIGNKLLGLINLSEKEGQFPFTEVDFEQAKSFASHIAIAFENIRTTNRLRGENQELGKSVNELRENLKQHESLVAVGKLALHLAHELSNPLDAIRRFVNLALDQTDQDSISRQYLLKAKQGIRRSVQVIRGLLEFSGTMAKTRSRRIEIHGLLDQTINAMVKDPVFERVIIERQFSVDSYLVEDCSLHTVFENLFQNSHHAMKGIGKIIVATKGQGREVVVTVRDSGPGVPESIKARIFEPFFTTKENGRGNGIGLSICKEIIEKCGGRINFESQQNKGTEFVITLPCKILK